MTQTVARLLTLMFISFAVGHGWLSKEDANSLSPDLMNALALALGGLVVLAWSYGEKLFKGHITPLGKSIPSETSTTETSIKTITIQPNTTKDPTLP